MLILKGVKKMGGYFQLDRARVHICTPNKQLLNEHNIRVLDLVAKGADMFNVENVFNQLKRKAKEH
jgi:hypothetical protein